MKKILIIFCIISLLVVFPIKTFAKESISTENIEIQILKIKIHILELQIQKLQILIQEIQNITQETKNVIQEQLSEKHKPVIQENPVIQKEPDIITEEVVQPHLIPYYCDGCAQP